MEITAATVMQLRNKTGLSMMECKKALVETGGDMEKAEDFLRKAMKGKLDAKGDKPAGEGRIAVAVSSNGASIVELRANTDFTAKNDAFVNLTQRLADAALKAPAGAYTATGAEQAAIDDIRIKTGETITMPRAQHVPGGAGVVFGSYVHHDGKTGALIRAEGDVSPEVLKQVCMHIVAAVPSPKGVNPSDVPAEIVEKERKFRIEQAMESGKPKEIAEKMVEGGMRKFFEEIALLEQPYVIDPSKKVKDMVGKAKVTNFWRWAVGEQA
ncbi:MAG TPA: translation elongation factor Ts [Phycisphaerales bacterium]|nr:translation elongation factor Ts [Phycisphaerales bacterium]